MPRVHVHLIEARAIQPYRGKDPNPRPIIHVGKSKKWRGRTQKKTCDPEWHQVFDVYFSSKNPDQEELFIDIVQPRKFGKGSKLGQVRIPLEICPKNQEYVNWYPLEDGSGEVHVGIRGVDFGRSEAVSDGLPPPESESAAARQQEAFYGQPYNPFADRAVYSAPPPDAEVYTAQPPPGEPLNPFIAPNPFDPSLSYQNASADGRERRSSVHIDMPYEGRRPVRHETINHGDLFVDTFPEEAQRRRRNKKKKKTWEKVLLGVGAALCFIFCCFLLAMGGGAYY